MDWHAMHCIIIVIQRVVTSVNEAFEADVSLCTA